jgi:hypothetical protein
MMGRPRQHDGAPDAHIVIVTGPVPAIDESQAAPAGEHEEAPCL